MKHARLLAAAALLSAASVGAPVASEPLVRVQAQPEFRSDLLPPNCGSLEAAILDLTMNYDFRATLIGKTARGFNFIFMVNLDNNGWVVLEAYGDLACVVMYGSDIRPAPSLMEEFGP
jgi:hypothetical protein